jgi:hypothetical protein
MPAGYLFHQVPMHSDRELVDPIEVTLAEMDRFGVQSRLHAGIAVVSLPRVNVRSLRGAAECRSFRWDHVRHDGTD